MLRGRVLASVAGTAALITAAPAGAATLTVNTDADEAIPGDHTCSLREAVIAVSSPGSASGDCAPAAFGVNTIVLGSSRYELNQTGLGELRVSPTVTSLTIRGAGEGNTLIDAGSLLDRALEVSAGATVVIRNLSISGGNAHAGVFGTFGASGVNGASGTAGTAGANGGAILNAGSLTLVDTAVTHSNAGAGGDGGPGGVGTGGPGGSGGDGGRGGSGGGIYNTGSLTLQGVTLADDHAGNGGRGGTGAQGVGSAGNGGAGGAGGDGGAISNAGGTVAIVASTLRGDGTGAGGSGGNGGASANGGNAGAGGAVAGGGGIANDSGSLSVTNSTFASNTAGPGGIGGAGGPGAGGGSIGGAGGLGGAGGSGGNVLVGSIANAAFQSVTIAGGAPGNGGLGGGGGTGSTAGAAGIAGVAGTAGGVADQGTSTTVQNSILASNSSSNCSGTITDSGLDLSFGGGGCPATFLNGDPNLGPLQDNGGPTATISLGAGSAALDKVPASGAGCQPTDERGVARPSGAACDIGAYELAPPKATTGPANASGLTSETLSATVTPNAGDATVQFLFGRSTKYGSKSAVKHVGGVRAVGVSIRLSRLKPKTKYHYRVILTSIDGAVKGLDRTFTTSPTPVLGSLKIAPRRFRAGSKGAIVTYTDTEASSIRFVVQHTATGVKLRGRCVAPSKRSAAGPRCKRLVTDGSFTRTDKIGMNTVRLIGRLGRHKLAPGVYVLQLTPQANRQVGRSVKLTFRIAP